jgi:hypothetical protein
MIKKKNKFRGEMPRNPPNRVPLLGESIVQARVRRPEQRPVLAHVELCHLVLLLGGPDFNEAAPRQVDYQYRGNVLPKEILSHKSI